MRTKTVILIAGAALALSAVPAWAHHAFAAEFDAKKPLHFEGTVTKVELINPHAWIHVEVKGTEGVASGEWMVEAGSPNVLLRRGFTKQTVAIGTQVVIDGYQSKDGSNRMNGRDITLPNGQKLFLGSQNTGAPTDGPGPGRH